mmetsp:Transcript_59985/g.159597  ORF Transcript_59985/g.159597 Transcript_59985/m.159597 type:complete len:203 (-) Transcript_59985:911-1519(-)
MPCRSTLTAPVSTTSRKLRGRLRPEGSEATQHGHPVAHLVSVATGAARRLRPQAIRTNIAKEANAAHAEATSCRCLHKETAAMRGTATGLASNATPVSIAIMARAPHGVPTAKIVGTTDPRTDAAVAETAGADAAVAEAAADTVGAAAVPNVIAGMSDVTAPANTTVTPMRIGNRHSQMNSRICLHAITQSHSRTWSHSVWA